MDGFVLPISVLKIHNLLNCKAIAMFEPGLL
jgi:hypothetical protein